MARRIVPRPKPIPSPRPFNKREPGQAVSDTFGRALAQSFATLASLIQAPSELGNAVSPNPTITIVWRSATNPESIVFPWAGWLVSLWTNQVTNEIYISTNGITSVGTPTVAGLGGALLACFIPNGSASVPWTGRSRIEKNQTIYQGGTGAGTSVTLVFEISKAELGI